MAAASRSPGAGGAWILCLACLILFPAAICLAAPSDPASEADTTIGIDFGEMHMRVGVARGGQVSILPPEYEGLFSPTYIAFTENGTLFGEAARLRAAVDPQNTIFGIRRLLGRNFSDIQSDIEHLPFRIVSKAGRPVVQVEVAGQAQQYSPEDLFCMVLSKVRDTAERYLGSTIDSAAITFPTSFDDAQRDASLMAAEAAGLPETRLLAEPVAAGIAHQLDSFDEKHFLVYGLDETLSINVVELDNGVYERLAKANGVTLSTNDSSTAGIFEESIKLVEGLLEEANITKLDIYDVVLTGSSQELTNLRPLLQDYFRHRVRNVATPAETLVIGAAVWAEILVTDENLSDIDILPLSIGIEAAGGIMAKLIPRSSMIPAGGLRNFTTAVNNQSTVVVKVFEGERAMARDNIFMGRLELPIPPQPRGPPLIEVHAVVDENCILTVVARSVASGSEARMSVLIDREEHYRYGMVDYLVLEAEKYAESDEVLRQLLPENGAIQGGQLV